MTDIENLLTAENMANAKWVYHYMMMFSGVVGLACGLVFIIWGLTSRKLHRLRHLGIHRPGRSMAASHPPGRRPLGGRHHAGTRLLSTTSCGQGKSVHTRTPSVGRGWGVDASLLPLREALESISVLWIKFM